MDLRLPFPPDPEHAADLAETGVAAARRVSGVELDYSAESLVFVDEQMDRFAEQGCQIDEIASTIFCFGCYVGEVVVRDLGGRWVQTEESPMKGTAAWPMVTLMTNGDCWNPIGKVFKRFVDGPSESVVYFFRIAKGSQP